MAEIRVAKPARRGRAWLWLVPLVLVLAAGAWFLTRDRGATPEASAARDTTVSTGVIDPATGTATPMAPSPAQVGDTAPGAPATGPNAEASKNGGAGVAAPGPGPR